MRKSFILNDYHSLMDYKVLVQKGPPYIINNEHCELINIDGRNGSVTIKDGTYPDIKLPFEVRILSKNSTELHSLIDEIIDWLTISSNNDKLIYDREDVYYIVKRVNFGDIANEIRAGGTFELDFICEPFKYVLGEHYITLENNTTIYYSGTVPGECNVKIYGNGNIQLTINDETVQINNVNEYVELDSKLLLCLNKDKTSKSIDMIGHFPLLTRGSNCISWTGSVSKVEILLRTAYR